MFIPAEVAMMDMMENMAREKTKISFLAAAMLAEDEVRRRKQA